MAPLSLIRRGAGGEVLCLILPSNLFGEIILNNKIFICDRMKKSLTNPDKFYTLKSHSSGHYNQII